MTEEAVQFVAFIIRKLNLQERARLVQILQQDDEGTAGVIAKLSDPPPDREDGIELELPEDYWETAQ